VREVEVKARLYGDAEKVIDRLTALGVVLEPPTAQVDLIFVPAPLNLSQTDGSEVPIVRIRTEVSDEEVAYHLTVKRDLTDQLDSMHLETSVGDLAVATAILVELGLHPVVEVRKNRRRGRLGRFEICLDSVHDLGTFIEVESLNGEVGDVAAVRAEMWQLLRQLDVPIGAEVKVGYDRLIEDARRAGGHGVTTESPDKGGAE
jgi:predicted adenylyl cyclase CyaB